MDKVRAWALDILFYIVGGIIYGVSLMMFATPNQIAPGGASGIATVLNYLFGLPVGTMVLLINIPLLFLGWRYLGKQFIQKTAVATVVVSVTIDLVGLIPVTYQGDLLLASLYGGLLAGAGLGLFFMRGATSGGTDIVVRLLQKRWPFLSVGRFVLIVDTAVVLFAAVVFRDVESALYAMIFIFITSRVIDSFLFGQVNGKVVTIITTKEEEISREITENFARGLTVLDVRGGYTKENKVMIYCAVRNTQVVALSKAVRLHDPDAFMVISEAGEVIGQFEH
ncbi:MAG: YitT family protein [Clostridiales bacterium]|nr:YitT family protein [Clostridiales bacterium]